MNASSVDEATEIDYLITNFQDEQVTGEWIVKNFLRETTLKSLTEKRACWLGLNEKY